MLPNQLLQLQVVLPGGLLDPGDAVPGHEHLDLDPLAHDPREDLPQFGGGPGRLGRGHPCVFELVETLPHGVGVGHLAGVHKGDVLDAPGQQIARELGAQSACAQKQTPRTGDHVQVDVRQHAPPHQL